MDLPVVKMNRITKFYIFDSLDKKECFKKFRGVCSNYIKKSVVRDAILKKCNHNCVICNANKILQIDHIVSVKRCFDNKMFDFCNKYENLQILCYKCNAAKKV